MRPRRIAVAVWVALIALLGQLMTPAASLAAQAAMAADPAACADMPGMSGMDMSHMAMAGGDMTGMDMAGMDMAGMDHGSKAASGKSKGFAGLPCQDCLAPATAALPPSLASPVPVSYATAYVRMVAFVRYIVPPARAPPRPPGQGPPLSDA